MQWFLLFIAGTFEITWAVAMKYSEGFTKLGPAALTAVTGTLLEHRTVGLTGVHGRGETCRETCVEVPDLTSRRTDRDRIALKKLPLGTAYAMWTGMGIIGTTVLGVLLFKETLSMPQILCIILIAGGIAGLKLLA